VSEIDIQEISDPSTVGQTARRDLVSLRTALMRELAIDERPASVGWALSFLHLGSDVVRRRPLLAYDRSGRIVGQAVVTLDQVGGNTHIAEVAGVEVHPDERRRGIGRSLLASVVTIAEEERRTSLVPWGVRSDASMAFWDSVGMPEVAIDRLSRLRLADVDRDLTSRWRTDCSARQQGYDIHRWRGRCPDALIGQVVAAQQGMLDAPTDDLDMAPETLDEAWTRAREGSWGERGGEIWGMLAVSPNGEAAALTELITMRHRPSFVMQQGTTTLHEHRNQGLGRWLKAEMLEQLLATKPEADVIETGNAATNAAMLAINDELGFRPFVELTTRQTATADLVTRL
jgi:GNAT superfamily N-acetyltransferase